MTTMETGKKWYVVKAISGKEKKVQERIRYEISRNHLEDYVSQVLIPTEKVVQAKNGKKVTKERNYLPGYVLIEAHQQSGHAEPLSQVQHRPGIRQRREYAGLSCGPGLKKDRRSDTGPEMGQDIPSEKYRNPA